MVFRAEKTKRFFNKKMQRGTKQAITDKMRTIRERQEKE